MAIKATASDGKGNEIKITGTVDNLHYEVKSNGKTTYEGDSMEDAKKAKGK